ncbi:MAG TPA: hypothetical protein VK013_05990 [Myxococcaceae bacterium]|nr:hypothetical protein [Myxococcaceae bacterium]
MPPAPPVPVGDPTSSSIAFEQVSADDLAGRPHLLTLLAVGLLVIIASRLLHEIVGHGLPCVLGGGEWRGFSTSWTVCADAGMSSTARGVQLAGGTVIQLLAGLFALGWLRLRPPTSGLGYAVLWQTAAVNLFLATGPLMIDPITGAHEWGDVLRLHLTAPAWRWGGMAVGAILTMGGYVLLLRQLEPLLASAPAWRTPLVRALCWGPLLLGAGLVLPLASLRNVLGMGAAYDSTMTVFGAVSFLFWIPFSATAAAPGKPPGFRCTPIARVPALWGLALVVAFLTIWLVGPGVPISS